MPDVIAVKPTFFVSDVKRSADWYVRVLGFEIEFMSDDYAGVGLGPVRIHLAQAPKAIKGAAYLQLASGVDEYVAQIVARGHALTHPVKDHDYGMREATVRDPDGNDLYIGQVITPAGA